MRTVSSTPDATTVIVRLPGSVDWAPSACTISDRDWRASVLQSGCLWPQINARFRNVTPLPSPSSLYTTEEGSHDLGKIDVRRVKTSAVRARTLPATHAVGHVDVWIPLSPSPLGIEGKWPFGTSLFKHNLGGVEAHLSSRTLNRGKALTRTVLPVRADHTICTVHVVLKDLRDESKQSQHHTLCRSFSECLLHAWRTLWSRAHLRRGRHHRAPDARTKHPKS